VEVTDGAISSPSPPFGGRAIAFGKTVAFLSSVIPAEAGIQGRVTGFGVLDSRFRGNDGNTTATERPENPNAIAQPSEWLAFVFAIL
jgi:hypothetical protein